LSPTPGPPSAHLFRDTAATAIAIDRPEQARLAVPLLGHHSLATTERHYNLASIADAD
jgi:integrase